MADKVDLQTKSIPEFSHKNNEYEKKRNFSSNLVFNKCSIQSIPIIHMQSIVKQEHIDLILTIGEKINYPCVQKQQLRQLNDFCYENEQRS